MGKISIFFSHIHTYRFCPIWALLSGQEDPQGVGLSNCFIECAGSVVYLDTPPGDTGSNYPHLWGKDNPLWLGILLYLLDLYTSFLSVSLFGATQEI
jgi:hypothetical protein